jgi:hypothetical protein
MMRGFQPIRMPANLSNISPFVDVLHMQAKTKLKSNETQAFRDEITLIINNKDNTFVVLDIKNMATVRSYEIFG